MAKGRSTGVKVDRRPKAFYFIKDGKVMEKAGGGRAPARDTGKRVKIQPGHFGYVDRDGTVREVERANGRGSNGTSKVSLSDAKRELEAEWRRDVEAGRTRLGFADWLKTRRR